MKNLLLLHGALGAKSQLEPLIDQLSTEFKCYSLNFEGHGGRISYNSFSIELFSQNLVDFMNEKNLEKVDVFGYSMGGYVALKTALSHPHRIGTIITLGTKFNWTVASAAQEVKMLNPEKIEEKVPKFASYLKRLHQPNEWKELLMKTANMMLNLGDKPSLSDADFESIRHICYIGVGDHDEMVSREETQKVASLLPNGSFYLMKDTTHPIDRVDPGKIIDKIKQTIK